MSAKIVFLMLAFFFSHSSFSYEIEPGSAFKLDFFGEGLPGYAYRFQREANGQLFLYGFDFGNGNPMHPFKVEAADENLVVYNNELRSQGLFIVKEDGLGFSLGYHTDRLKSYIWFESQTKDQNLADGRVRPNKTTQVFNATSDNLNLIPTLPYDKMFAVQIQNSETGILEQRYVVAVNSERVILSHRRITNRDMNSEYFENYDVKNEDNFSVHLITDRRLVFGKTSRSLNSHIKKLIADVNSSRKKATENTCTQFLR